LITKYGYDVVGVVVLIVVIGSLVTWLAFDGKLLRWLIPGVLLAVLLFTLYFFRDPDRSTPAGDNLVIAPADGEVILIKDHHEDEYLHADAVQVSIFMSPFNVHVNRFPISGRIGYFRYFPGEYLVAYDEKSSLRNERTHIGVENQKVKVLFKQIAGFVARRIVADLKEGDPAVAGERFGMIRFGSRVDVLVPRSATLSLKQGDRTVAGETVIAVVP
jgi:phosphatidylserine decarboxylase